VIEATEEIEVTSWPATVAEPSSIGSNVVSSLMVVVLPAPLGPSRPRIEPGGTEKLNPSTARVSPNRLRRPVASMTGASRTVDDWLLVDILSTLV